MDGLRLRRAVRLARRRRYDATAEPSEEAMAIRVQDVMRRDVVGVPSSLSLLELEEVLLRHGIGGAPVVDAGQVVGVVSRSDLLKHRQVEKSQAESVSDYFLEPGDEDGQGGPDPVAEAIAARWPRATVGDVMTRELVRVRPDAPLAEAACTMLERRVHRVLVMDGGALVGLVSSLDLIRLFAEGRVRAA
jgi:CBS domain-containing protein